MSRRYFLLLIAFDLIDGLCQFKLAIDVVELYCLGLGWAFCYLTVTAFQIEIVLYYF